MAELRDFQRTDVDYLKSVGLKALIASAPGTGKTCVTIRATVEEYRKTLPAVVVCPASVTQNWRKEIKTWAPGVRVVLITDGTSPLPPQVHPHTFYILSWALLDSRGPELKRRGVKCVIADEAHFAKSEVAIRSQSLCDLTDGLNHVLLLTGTPIINTQDDLDMLHRILGSSNPPMVRRLLEDVAPDVPPKRRAYLNVLLSDHYQAEYEHANTEFEEWLYKEKSKLLGSGCAEAEVERVLAAEALAKIGYLRRLVGEAKAQAAVDWIARAVRVGEPVVVFVEHQVALKKISKGLRKQRIRHIILDGSTPNKERQAAVDGFQANEYPVFIGTKAAKEGITLTAARHLLFAERFYTSAEEEQAEDRIRRIGQKFPTTIWFLHAPDTVDDRIDTIVKTKRQIIRTAIGSADIAETALGNTEALIRNWGKHASQQKRPLTELGHGPPLAALPPPHDTHAVIFSGNRWNPESAARWCRMNGYLAVRVHPLEDRIQATIHEANHFVAQKFKTVSVATDIKLILGVRLSRPNEKLIVRAKRRAEV